MDAYVLCVGIHTNASMYTIYTYADMYVGHMYLWIHVYVGKNLYEQYRLR